MAALQTLHRQLHAGAVGHPAGHRQMDGGSGAAGAGHSKDTLVLRVQIQQSPALQHGQVDDIGAQHTDLLVYGDDHFQRGMRNAAVGKQRQGIRHGNTVIAAQSGSPGEHTLAVMGHIQALPVHVNGAVLVLLADHIHMALEHHGRMVLQTAGAFLEEDHIVALVLDITQTLLPGKGNKIVRNQLGVPGSVRDGTELFKISKYSGRLQTRQAFSDHK